VVAAAPSAVKPVAQTANPARPAFAFAPATPVPAVYPQDAALESAQA